MDKSGWFFHCGNLNKRSESVHFELHLVIAICESFYYSIDLDP